MRSGTSLWRVHDEARPANGFFNGVGAAPTRFGPLAAGTGHIPILYAGLDEQGALFESVFHDVPLRGVRTLQVARLSKRVRSRLELQRDVQLADFTTIGLPSLNTTRVEMIESESIAYAETAQWAGAIHQDNPDLDGIFWVSRRNDQSQVVVLFGDRVATAELKDSGSPEPLWHGSGFDSVAYWADRADITLI